ncbi:MAG: hypothetical protein AAF802_06645 [Planctomycetota bacterium]
MAISRAFGSRHITRLPALRTAEAVDGGRRSLRNREHQERNRKGLRRPSTPTLMVLLDNQLKHTASGLLRDDRLQAFLARLGFSNRNEDDQPTTQTYPTT